MVADITDLSRPADAEAIKLALLALVLASLAAGGRAYLSRDSPKSGADPAPARAAMPLRLITAAVRVGIKGVGIQGND